jgi:hypothetical protein
MPPGQPARTEPDTTSNTRGWQPSSTDRSDGATSNNSQSNNTGGSSMQSAGPTGPASGPLGPVGAPGSAGSGQPMLPLLPIHIDNFAAAAGQLPDAAHLLHPHLPPGAIPGPLLHFLRTFPQTVLAEQQQQQSRPGAGAGAPAVLGPGGVLGPAGASTAGSASHRAAALARYLEKKKSRTYQKKVGCCC